MQYSLIFWILLQKLTFLYNVENWFEFEMKIRLPDGFVNSSFYS